MKLKLITSIFFLLIGFSEVYAWISEGSCTEHKCEICGATIYTYDESTFGIDMGMSNYGYPFCLGEYATSFINETHHICNECRTKYEPKYLGIVANFYKEVQRENKDKIAQHDKERKEKLIIEKKEKLMKLKKEIKLLEQEN